uniref:CACTA en-spm transposon protein n=1 Tax=Cucumis melo TaxID=3656 RepID=A0A9I9ELC9_CUCME
MNFVHVKNFEIGIMSSSYPCNNFLEMDAMFLEFADDLDNLTGGLSSVGNNSGSPSQPPATLTPRRHAQSRLLELERYIVANGCISMTIAPSMEKSICPHVVRFSQAIGAGWTLAENKLRSSRPTFRGKSVDRVELFQKTHVRAGTFVSQATEDAHNQMLKLQSQPTPEGPAM